MFIKVVTIAIVLSTLFGALKVADTKIGEYELEQRV